MSEQEFGFETLQIHAGQKPDPATGARAVPIYQTTSFVYENFDRCEKLSTLKEFGYTYSRIINPTVEVFETRVAALEGGSAGLAVGSGSAAVTYAILNIAGIGDEIVSASTLYGGTYNLFSVTLPKLGIHTILVDPDDPENFRKAITDKTKALYLETIGNPGINLVDIKAVADIAHENGIPLIVDNTFGTPYLIRPIEYGADIVVHSATKFIGGHGTTIGGVIAESGKFDWSASNKFPGFTTPDAQYGGIKYYEKFKETAFTVKARVQFLRDTGAALSPFNAFLLLQGLETLSLRVEKHLYNTRKVTEFLTNHPLVSWVNYPSLESNKYYELAQKYLPKGAGSIITFGLKGGYEAAVKVIDNIKLFSLLANVGDAKSLIIHPASTTHAQLSDEELGTAGIAQDTIRLSIGIEDHKDLIWDLGQAFEKIA